jgi:hypothetical protein
MVGDAHHNRRLTPLFILAQKLPRAGSATAEPVGARRQRRENNGAAARRSLACGAAGKGS